MISLQRDFLVQEDESNYVQFIFSSLLLSIWTQKYVKDGQREMRTIIVGNIYYTNEVLVFTIYNRRVGLRVKQALLEIVLMDTNKPVINLRG